MRPVKHDLKFSRIEAGSPMRALGHNVELNILKFISQDGSGNSRIVVSSQRNTRIRVSWSSLGKINSFLELKTVVVSEEGVSAAQVGFIAHHNLKVKLHRSEGGMNLCKASLKEGKPLEKAGHSNISSSLVAFCEIGGGERLVVCFLLGA